MAHHTEATIKVKVPKQKVWQVLEDFSSVENFASTIKSSPVISDIKSGIGARRQCTFNDDSSLVEEIVDFQEGQGFKMALSEYSLPLKSMEAEMSVKAINEESCEIYMSSKFVVKGGPLGWLMGQFLMRPMMKGVFKKVMSGLAYYSETGERVDDEMPAKDKLEKLVFS